MIKVAAKRQQTLEEADMKKDDTFTPAQWRVFWANQNKYFGRYYKFIAHHKNGDVAEDQENKNDEEFEFPKQIDLPKGYAKPESFVTMPTPSTPGGEGFFDDFDLITGNSQVPPPADIVDPFAEHPNDPFAEQPGDPFAEQPGDPFADKPSSDPFGDKPLVDPFADKPSHLFPAKTDDPFADTIEDPFAGTSSDPFADKISDPFTSLPTQLSSKPDKNNDDDVLNSFFSNDTSLVSS